MGFFVSLASRALACFAAAAHGHHCNRAIGHNKPALCIHKHKYKHKRKHTQKPSLTVEAVADALQKRILELEQELATLDFLETQIESAEQRLEDIMKVSAEADLLKTLPCVGKILSMVLLLEIGKVDRFPTAAHLASYAGSGVHPT